MSGRTKPESRPAALFIYKAIATTVAGGILTLIVAIAQLSYGNHLERLRRQSEQGATFQAHLLEITGNIQEELWRAALEASSLRADSEQLRQLSLRNSQPVFDRWRVEVLLLRNQGAQIYGNEVGALIYDSSDSLFHADGCEVVRRDSNPSYSDCTEPRLRELNQLAPFVGRLSRSENLDTFRTNTGSPISFDANATIAYSIISHYYECIRSRASNMPVKPRCRNLPQMLEIARRRVSLVGVARENLADAIMTASAIRD